MPRHWFWLDNDRKSTRTIEKKHNTVSVVLVAMGKVESIEKSGIGLNDYAKLPTPGGTSTFITNPQVIGQVFYFHEIQKIYKLFFMRYNRYKG